MAGDFDGDGTTIDHRCSGPLTARALRSGSQFTAYPRTSGAQLGRAGAGRL